MGLIDTHAHLTSPAFAGRIDDLLAKCAEAGVDEIITVGTNLADSRAAVTLAERFAGRVHAAAGVHPHEAGKVHKDDLIALPSIWERREVVAVGEIGLDYHYDFADRTVQREVFARQLELASAFDKPVVIHAREALDDVIQILEEWGFAKRRVVFHCFTGTADEASRIASLGWWLSFTGVVTFKNSEPLRDIAREYPADRLMVETDSPYLSPVPVRSIQPNTPANLVHTVRFLGELRGVSYDSLVEQTALNSRTFFDL